MMECFVEAMRHSGIEYIVMEPHQSFSSSVIAIDADENFHECWEGHSLVNVCVPMCIEDAVRYFKDPSCFSAENAKLRELVYDMLEDEEHGHNDDMTFREHVIRAHKYGIAKDIEV